MTHLSCPNCGIHIQVEIRVSQLSTPSSVPAASTTPTNEKLKQQDRLKKASEIKAALGSWVDKQEKTELIDEHVRYPQRDEEKRQYYVVYTGLSQAAMEVVLTYVKSNLVFTEGNKIYPYNRQTSHVDSNQQQHQQPNQLQHYHLLQQQQPFHQQHSYNNNSQQVYHHHTTTAIQSNQGITLPSSSSATYLPSFGIVERTQDDVVLSSSSPLSLSHSLPSSPSQQHLPSSSSGSITPNFSGDHQQQQQQQQVDSNVMDEVEISNSSTFDSESEFNPLTELW